MTYPKTRALELVGAIDELWQNECDLEAPLRALRLAITQIPTTSWQPMEMAPVETMVRVLIEGGRRKVVDGYQTPDGHWWAGGDAVPLGVLVLAWRPADPTDLPPDWPHDPTN